MGHVPRIIQIPYPAATAMRKRRRFGRRMGEAWDAIMWAGGPARPAPGDVQAEPTIGKAINGGYDLLEAKCNRCRRVSIVPAVAAPATRHADLEV
jgi:hypothetical protein